MSEAVNPLLIRTPTQNKAGRVGDFSGQSSQAATPLRSFPGSASRIRRLSAWKIDVAGLPLARISAWVDDTSHRRKDKYAARSADGGLAGHAPQFQHTLYCVAFFAPSVRSFHRLVRLDQGSKRHDRRRLPHQPPCEGQSVATESIDAENKESSRGRSYKWRVGPEGPIISAAAAQHPELPSAAAQFRGFPVTPLTRLTTGGLHCRPTKLAAGAPGDGLPRL